MREIFSKIIGAGSYLPERILTNDDLSKMVDTSDEWIYTRSGIKTRHIVAGNETTSSLAVNAIKDAIKKNNINVNDIDLLIVATTTPDLVVPSTACLVQKELGLLNAVAFDLNAACTGFVYALTVADSMIKSGNYKTAIVVGAETLSRIVDWKDRSTCVLFGDGAGCVILQATDEKTGILSSIIKSDGNYAPYLTTTGGVSKTKSSGTVMMNGKEVFKLAITRMPEIAKETVIKAGFNIEDVDVFVPHQANIRIIDVAVEHLGIPHEKTIKIIKDVGNTSAACIPIAIDYALSNDKVKKGNKVLLASMGGGFTWGAVFLEF